MRNAPPRTGRAAALVAPLLALALLVAALPVRAVEMGGLYQARAPVADKEAASREAALGQLLQAVAVKVSGQPDPQAARPVVEAMHSPDSYVQQFRYESVAPSGTTQGQAPRLMLWASFDNKAIDDLLTRAGLPIWGRVRPTLLVWLAVERDDQRRLVGADDSSDLGPVLESAAAERGLPLVLPLLDLEDRSHVAVSDVWGGFQDRLVAASQRYQAKAILVARASHAGGALWQINWHMLLGDKSWDWSTQDDVLEAALADGVHKAADVLAARFAQVAGAEPAAGVQFTVGGVRDVADYARALHYLQSLEIVSHVEVVEAAGDRVTFDLQVHGGLDAFNRMIALSRTLAPTNLPDGPRFKLLP